MFRLFTTNNHWGKADDRNCKCNYGHPKMADVESDKNLFCRLNCILNGTCIGTIVITNLSQGNHKLRLKNVYERENPI